MKKILKQSYTAKLKELAVKRVKDRESIATVITELVGRSDAT
ncbi:hypothetical protein S2091_1152 [Solimicrobium silvestre]|uniref:Uncharacterized protein n=1 Tax=Solimicrobium silvestre TaxID=2099400 RepID=A0A2S9H1Y0_9BURK|nr:hypothetical protein S2091_1152 [Solimicrobium silvestre]